MASSKNEKTYDVVIVGAGPAGLVVGAWMSVAGVKTLLVDQNAAPPSCGHADGLDRRSFEILDMFDLGRTIWQEAHQTIEVSYWSGSDETISRKFTRPNASSGAPFYSTYSQATLGQGRIEQHILNFIKERGSVDTVRSHRPTALEMNPVESHATGDYPVQVKISDCSQENADRLVRCRYLVGCDGAHSWVRKRCGLKLEGDSTDHHWGVIDCLPITDFPDIRKRCIIKSASGCTMIIPRERQLVRFYVQLSSCHKQAGLQEQQHAILSKIKAILRPFAFSTEIVEWSSLYSVGQRMCNTYSIQNRIFLAGDAVHTHSPKAGQGMNTSMQDAFNLGWKLASVIQGCHPPEILETYQEERLPIARQLLSFDKEIYGAVSDKSSSSRDKTLTETLRKENNSASGSAIRYHPNMLFNHTNSLKIAPHLLELGCRVPDLKVMNHSDAHMWRLHALLNRSGNWTLLVFAGNVCQKSQLSGVKSLAMRLSEPRSVFQQVKQRFGQHMIGGIEPYLIHSGPRHDIDLHSLPSLFVPRSESSGYDYGRVFADNESYEGVGGTMYRELDIPPEGCMVLVRPDHHVAFYGELEDVPDLEAFVMRLWKLNRQRL